MLRRVQHRRFKYFFAYIVAQIAINAVVFPAYWYSYSGYFYLYWITDAISMALGFALIYEAFVDVFQSDISMGVVNMVAYNGALLIWLGYALKSPARVMYPLPRSQRWEPTLIDPLPSDSSVPIFEGMVDLDLSRSQAAPSSAIYKELSLLESELNENIKALKFTSAQISRRLGRLNILARNPPSRGENAGDT
jgi:hypothetical protein